MARKKQAAKKATLSEMFPKGKTARPRNKFRAIKTTVDGITFDSKKESVRYLQLKDMLQKGEITNLELQPKYPIVVSGVKICTYNGDFSYLNKDGIFILEDVKSKATKTPAYRLKKKLVKALYSIDITEVE